MNEIKLLDSHTVLRLLYSTEVCVFGCMAGFNQVRFDTLFLSVAMPDYAIQEACFLFQLQVRLMT